MKLNYRKLRLSFALLIGCGVLGLVNAARADEPDPTTPQPMPISCRAPKPAGQSGLRRPQGDGNVWTFTITTDPDDNVHWVDGPNWSYPGKGAGSDPSWGVWGGGDDEMWLSWSSPQIAAPFTVKVTGKITCGTGPGGGEPIDIEASWSGEVTSFDIFVRRMGTSDEFGKSATVAAGVVGNDAHQAEIEVRARDAAGNPVAGVSIPEVVISSGGLSPQHDGSVSATVSMTQTITDASGLAHGIFTSGHRTETTQLKLPENPNDPDGPGNAADVVQTWNQLTGEDAWTYPPYFDYGEPDTITYHMTFADDVPIAGHGMDFVTTGLFGVEWNPDIGEDWTGWDVNGEPDFIPDGFPDGDYEPAAYTDDDADPTGWNYWNALSEFSAVTENPAGSYNSDQIIYDDEDFWVDSVTFDIVDGNAFDENGED